MAKGNAKFVPPEDNQEEMTVVIFKLKGTGNTLQKGFDALNTAFSSIAGSPVQMLPPRKTIAASRTLIEGTADQAPEEEYAEDESADSGEEASSTASTKPWQPRKYKFLDDFDLNPGETSWKDFATAKSPTSDAEKYLIASLWITEYGGKSDFGIAHVFTCFRAMGWSEQKDFSQPMRQMKSKKSYFTNPSKKTWKLTGVGIDAAKQIQNQPTE